MRPLLIVGASGRAAAQVMARRGWTPTVIDFFADTDCPHAVKCESWDHAAALAERLDPMPWIYTGGMENHPAVIERISRRHSLLGNNSDTVRRVRDMGCLSQIVQDLGFRMPEMSETCVDGWLHKRSDSAGGMGVEFFTPLPSREGLGEGPAAATDSCQVLADTGPSPGPSLEGRAVRFWQRFINGTPVSAAFEDDVLIGTSIQLCGTPWLHASGFLYAGNIRNESPYRDEWERLGCGLYQHFGLRGFWGLDAIDDGERLWILELNPRFTASMELYEPDAPNAKGIYYAANEVCWKPQHVRCADIAVDGAIIPKGEPVCTIFGDSLLELQHTARILDEELS